MTKKLQGQVAIITGAGRGIGAATAQTLARAGAAVVLIARSAEQIDAVAAQLRNEGCRAIAVPIDVSDAEQVEAVVQTTMTEFNRIDILVNNAAIVWPVDEVAEADPDEWAYQIHVNLVAPFYMARNVLPVMFAQKHGRIINIGSGAGQIPIPGMSAYCATKAGLDIFTRILGKEVAGTGVTANLLSPGMVDTEMQSDIRSVDTSESKLDYGYWHDAYAKGELIAPADTARLIYWLAGPWSRERNGEIFSAGDARWVAQVHHDIGIEE